MSAEVTGPERVYRVVCAECKQSEFRRDKGLAKMLADAHNAERHKDETVKHDRRT